VHSRWVRSRNPTVTHISLHATISDLHLLSDDALLSSSVQYGIVARSFPFTGKVIKGYLSATGAFQGLGIGNPNADFTPNVTVCRLMSEGASAKVLWGFRDGSIAVMFYPRTMNGARTPAKSQHSGVEEEHRSAVLDAVWAAGGRACVTAGADGRIKVWSLRQLFCIWTSDTVPTASNANPCISVAEDLANGVVAGGFQSGDIVVYTGFSSSFDHVPGMPLPTMLIKGTRILASSYLTLDSSQPFGQEQWEISSLFIHVLGPNKVSVLASFCNSPLFFRYDIDHFSAQVDVVAFGDPASGSVECIQPFFSTSTDERSFIVVGDKLGVISIYDWEAGHGSAQSVTPELRREVFEDVSVTAVAMNSLVLVAGSSNGSIRVLDALSLGHLRSFAAPMRDKVRRIILHKDMLVASVGSRVLAWKAGPLPHGKPKGKGKARSTGGYSARWLGQKFCICTVIDS